MNICVVTDDNAGFTKKELEAIPNLFIVRMPIVINNDSFYEGVTIESDKFYQKLADGADIRTSQPAPGEILKLWDKLLKKFDAIIHIPMSSGLSNECQTALMLAEDYKEKVCVIDNHRISVTLKSSVYDALYLIEQGKTTQEIKKILLDEAYNSSIYIMVDTLEYLKKGGRVTPAGALLGSTFHIKPILTIAGGKLDSYKKAIGVKKAKIILIEAIKEDLANKFKDFDINDLNFHMAYTFDLEEAKTFKTEVSQALNIPEEKIILDPLPLSIATHIGPGALATTVTKQLHK